MVRGRGWKEGEIGGIPERAHRAILGPDEAVQGEVRLTRGVNTNDLLVNIKGDSVGSPDSRLPYLVHTNVN